MDFETMVAFYKFCNQIGMEINRLTQAVNELQSKVRASTETEPNVVPF